jgi:hypothetical protein
MDFMKTKLIVLTLALALAAPAAAAERPSSQVVIEAGLAVPYGDLDDHFENTRLGFGADDGLEIGFRYRLHLSSTLSISPSFHFVDYANFNGVHPEVDEYRIQTSSLRYAVELMTISEYRSFGRPRPFLALSAGLYRNRVQGFYSDFIQAIDESVSSLGVAFRGGVQIAGFELSLVYNINRFNTWHFHRSEYRERYNWDNLGIRAGWIIPFQ